MLYSINERATGGTEYSIGFLSIQSMHKPCNFQLVELTFYLKKKIS